MMPTGVRVEIRRLPVTRRHRAWPCSVNLPQWESIRFIHGPGQEHRGLYAGYESDRARWRNRVPGQEGQATV